MIARETTAIDIGCGPAIFLGQIADSNISWHGTDPTLEIVVEGRQAAPRLRRRGHHVWLESLLDNHAVPPAREKVARKSNLTASRVMEDPSGWQGMSTPTAATVLRGHSS